MLKLELYKVFINRKLLILVLIVLAAEALTAFLGINSELPTEMDKKQYLSLYNEFSGELTDDKLKKLSEEKTLFTEAAFAYEELEQYAKYLSGRDGGALFFEDADYAIKTGMPIINGCAWRALFGKPKQDILLAAAMLVYVLVSETAENETKVTTLKESSVFGHKRLYRLEALIGIVLASLLYVAVALIRFSSASIAFGLSQGSASVAALRSFENSPLAALSLNEGYLLTVALGVVGLSAYTSLLFIIGRLSRSSVTTALAAVLALILPPYIFKAPTLYYFSPISLMQSTGFLIGDVVEESAEIGGRIVWSTAAGRGSLPISLVIAFMLMLAAFMLRRRKGNGV